MAQRLFLRAASLAVFATLAGLSGCGKDSDGPADQGQAGGAGEGSDGGAAGAGESPIAELEPPPPPPTSDVAQPDAEVSEPNLRVLPWAGFSAAASYTFDDSQPSHAEHWPELDAAGVPMTFFINPTANWQANYVATWSEIGAAGHELGNHTWNHCHADLSDCTPIGTAEEEITETTDYIIETLGADRVISFAAPFGDTGWNTHAEKSMLVGRGVGSGQVPASGTSNWYNLPVFAVAANQTAEQFDAAIDSALDSTRWVIFMFHSLLPSANNWYAGVEMSELAANLTYASGLGDVWIDTMGKIGAYARAAQVFEELTEEDGTFTWTLPEHFPPGQVLRVVVDGGSLSQGGAELPWDPHGYYEIALDRGSLTWEP